MKKLATLLAASLLIGSAFARTSPTPAKALDHGDARHWVINVGLFIPTDDHEDLGVDMGFMASADYHFGNPGGTPSNTSWFAGVGGFFATGDDSLDSTAWGAHVGLLFGFGQPGDDNPWAIELKGGVYMVSLDGDLIDDDETGFGGSIGVRYMSQTGGGNNLRFTAGWFMLPEVGNVDHRGWFFSVGFPIGG
jgi:hypothetical protein